MAHDAATLLVILAIFLGQLYLFFTVESVPMRVALAIFACYQIWQKARRPVKNNRQEEQQ